MNVFAFQSRQHKFGSTLDFALIFLGLEDPDPAAIDDAYLSWSDSNVPPPRIVILGQADKMRAFYDRYVDPNARLFGLDRLYRHSKVTFCGFNYKGEILEINESGYGSEYTNLFFDAVNDFIQQQIEEADIVIPAPPGLYFDKLSARYSSHFIRAEALLQSTNIIELLALRLLYPFEEWCARSSLRVSGQISIFLDSMSIWPVGEKLTQLHRLGNPAGLAYRIESFRSYDGLETWKPLQRPSFVIISATTSGGLEQKVCAKLGGANANVWTILTLTARDDPKSTVTKRNSVFNLARKLKGKPSLDGLRDEFETDMSSIPPGTETISIVGERFLSQPAKPKRVRLVHKAIEESTKKILEKLARKEAIKVARGRPDAQARWTLSFDFNKLLDLACSPEPGAENSLLKNWLRNYSSPSPIAIVYPSSEGSAAKEVGQAAADLAQRTWDVLREIDPNVQAFTMTSDELANASRPFPYDLKTCSVIVVAPVIGNGFVFKQISALLRHKQPEGPRLFLALAVLPESNLHLTQLKNDISVTLDDRKYDFKYQFAVPIGRLDSAVQWLSEVQVLNELELEMQRAGVTAPAIIDRIRRLEALKTLEDNSVFLPSPDEKPLFLSTGFFLWPNSVDIEGGQYGGAILLSVAALLQGVRSSVAKANETSLRTGLFQHALMCPETFTRFNDASIQAALLRAAYPADLNYGVSPEISHDMERLLLKWIQYHNQPAGAAIGEFLLAIAIGKLKLRKEHLENVLSRAADLPGWLGCLARVAASRVLQVSH